jgi:hypothetical protein
MGLLDVPYCPNTECPNKDRLKKGEKCPKCGETVRMFSISDAVVLFNAKDKPTFELPFKEAEEQGKRVVTINDAVLSEDGIGKHLTLHTEAAQKHGYSLLNVTQTPAKFVIYLSLVFERKDNPIPKYVICTYCKTRFDSNKFFKCPSCGAIGE